MDKSAYHHGDLANALVAAALDAVEQDGPDAVSLRDLAQSLGVSRAAPYRHFEDRDALLAAVAARGFEDLNVGYEAALAAEGDGREKLRAAGRVYLDFARRRPGLFRLMFESDFLGRDHPPAVLIGPADKAYHLLWRAMEAACPDADERTIKACTITVWSTIYGYIALSRARRFKGFMLGPLSEGEVERAVIEATLKLAEG
jgi:AcrR family transcriptional regulator